MSIGISIENEIATIVLSNPKALNALSFDDFVGLADAFDRMSEDDTVHAIILTGTGRAFSAGAALDNLVDETGRSISPKALDNAFHGAVNRVARHGECGQTGGDRRQRYGRGGGLWHRADRGRGNRLARGVL